MCEYAVIAHVMFSMYFYGVASIFPTDSNIVGLDSIGVDASSITIGGSVEITDLIDRARKMVWFFAFFALYLIYKVLEKTAFKFLNSFLSCLFRIFCCCFTRSAKIHSL